MRRRQVNLRIICVQKIMQYSGHMSICAINLYSRYSVFLCLSLSRLLLHSQIIAHHGFCPLIWVVIENANNQFERFDIMIAIVNRQLIFSSFEYTHQFSSMSWLRSTAIFFGFCITVIKLVPNQWYLECHKI